MLNFFLSVCCAVSGLGGNCSIAQTYNGCSASSGNTDSTSLESQPMSPATPKLTTRLRPEIKALLSIPFSSTAKALGKEIDSVKEANVCDEFTRDLTGADANEISEAIGLPSLKTGKVSFGNDSEKDGENWIYFFGHLHLPVQATVVQGKCISASTLTISEYRAFIFSKISQFRNVINSTEEEVLGIDKYPSKVIEHEGKKVFEYDLGFNYLIRIIFKNGICVERECLAQSGGVPFSEM